MVVAVVVGMVVLLNLEVQVVVVDMLIMVALLALGLTIGNAAARRDGLIWLIWLHAILPGVISAWWLAGAPGLPRRAPPREALP